MTWNELQLHILKWVQICYFNVTEEFKLVEGVHMAEDGLVFFGKEGAQDVIICVDYSNELPFIVRDKAEEEILIRSINVHLNDVPEGMVVMDADRNIKEDVGQILEAIRKILGDTR